MFINIKKKKKSVKKVKTLNVEYKISSVVTTDNPVQNNEHDRIILSLLSAV